MVAVVVVVVDVDVVVVEVVSSGSCDVISSWPLEVDIVVIVDESGSVVVEGVVSGVCSSSVVVSASMVVCSTVIEQSLPVKPSSHAQTCRPLQVPRLEQSLTLLQSNSSHMSPCNKTASLKKTLKV